MDGVHLAGSRYVISDTSYNLGLLGFILLISFATVGACLFWIWIKKLIDKL